MRARSVIVAATAAAALLVVVAAAESRVAQEYSRPSLDRSYGGSPSQTVCMRDARNPALGLAGLAGLPSQVRVHYAMSELPPRSRRDSDRNGVPDYVECVQAAASAALEYFEGEQLRGPARDHAGGDSRTDIYVTRKVPGGAHATTLYSGGAHVVMRPDLELKHPLLFKQRTGKQVYQGIWMTVAHELFHVIQSQYLPTTAIPTWIREGTANAWATMMMRETTIDADRHVETWLEQSHLSVFGTRKRDCQSCYGSANFWLFFEFAAGLKPDSPDLPLVGPTVRLFERLGAMHAARKPIGLGWGAVEASFRSAYPSRQQSVFATFVDVLYPLTGPARSRKAKWPAYPEPFPRASNRNVRRNLTLPPLAAARVPITLPAGRATVEVTAKRSGRAMHAWLAVGGALGVRLDMAAAERTRTWHVVPAEDQHACRLLGRPIYLSTRQWAAIESISADEPPVICAKGAVDLVLANTSGTQSGRAEISYRVLSKSREVPGVDTAGDVPAGGPDVRRVTVIPLRDTVAWGIDVAGASPNDAFGIFMDTDEQSSTGATTGPETGSDYLFVYQGTTTQSTLWTWTNGAWAVRPDASVRASYNPGQPYEFVAELDPRAVSDPLRIRFFVLVEVPGSATLRDGAPSTGRWTTSTWRGFWSAAPSPPQAPPPTAVAAGKYAGTTSQNERITFEVMQGGTQLRDLFINSINLSCQPPNIVSFFGNSDAYRMPKTATIAADGTLGIANSVDFTDADGVRWQWDNRITGRFTGASASGEILVTATITVPSFPTPITCNAPNVNWKASVVP